MAEEFVIRNVAEDLVELYLDGCMKKSDMCLCERCTADVKAFALNHFPPHYVVTDFGDIMTRALALSNQFQVDIITAIMQAVVRVKESPRCNSAKAAEEQSAADEVLDQEERSRVLAEFTKISADEVNNS